MPITIDKGSKYFNTKLYTGSTSQQSITGVGFKPDLIWFKNRATVSRNQLYDAVRGTTKLINSDSADAEQTVSFFSSFDSDGYTIPSGSSALNGSGESIVSWNWLGANTTASNNSGSITSTVSANTTSGFSIVSYTGNATAGATVGHGLGVVPKMIILKRRTGSAEDWYVYHGSLANTEVLRLNLTNAKATRADFNNTTPTSTVFTINSTDNVNASGSTFIAYCFADVKGFSKAFSYTGNGSTDGTYVHLGFRPAWIIVKRTDSTDVWHILDNKRDTFNKNADWKYLDPASSGAEYDNNQHDFLSNGFKMRASGTNSNASGGTYIGFAIAENPFVSSKGVAVTAR